MYSIAQALRAFLICGLGMFLCASSARADHIVAITDESGNKIYINTGDDGTLPASGAGRSRLSPKGVPAVATQEIQKLVEKTAEQHQVDPKLVHAIIKAESQYDPNAVSPKGAMGLMQLIPATAQRFGVGNPFNPKENIEGGVSYLRYLLDLFGGDLSLSLAAYNAGEHAVQRSGGIPSFAETQGYVRKVAGFYQSDSAQSGAWATDKRLRQPSITRYMDEQGVVHYTNVE